VRIAAISVEGLDGVARCVLELKEGFQVVAPVADLEAPVLGRLVAEAVSGCGFSVGACGRVVLRCVRDSGEVFNVALADGVPGIHALHLADAPEDSTGGPVLDRLGRELAQWIVPYLFEQEANGATARLAAYVEAIGPPDAERGPLSDALRRLDIIEDERRRAIEVRGAVAELARERRMQLDALDAAVAEQRRLEAELAAARLRDDATRLAEAERRQDAISEATQRCFELSGVREFPLGQAGKLERMEMDIAAARARRETLQAKRRELGERIAQERGAIGLRADRPIEEVPEEAEAELAALQAEIVPLREQFERAEAARATAEAQHGTATEDLARLPDFSRLAADPVEWLTQLNTSFRAAQHARDVELDKRNRLHAETAHRRGMLTPFETIFVKRPNLHGGARDHEKKLRAVEEERNARRESVESLSREREDLRGVLPSFRGMSVVSVVFLVILGGFALWSRNPGVLIPLPLAGLCLLWFAGNWVLTRDSLRRVDQDLDIAQRGQDRIDEEMAAHRQAVEQILEEAGCETIRELEAMHDQYRRQCLELAALDQAAAQQETRAADAQGAFDALFASHRLTFEALGTPLVDEDAIDEVTGRSITRYQEYRDAKRRLSESRQLLTRSERETTALRTRLDAALGRERELSLDVREKMRASGYTEEGKHDSALRALRSYRIRVAKARERLARVATLEGDFERLTAEVDAAEGELARREGAMSEWLEAMGAKSVEGWREQAALAQEYRELWDKRSSLQAELDEFLAGEEIDELRRRVETGGTEVLQAARSPASIEKDMAAVEDREARFQEGLTALLSDIECKAASVRPLHEVEEDIAAVEERIETLKQEARAASYARSQIEEAARRRRVALAGRLSERASAFMSHLTGQAARVEVWPDWRVALSAAQEEMGSPRVFMPDGAYDTARRALSFALQKAIEDDSACIPLVWSESLDALSDEWLDQLLRTVSEMCGHGPVLLFAHGNRVVDAAARLSVPVIRASV